MDDDGRSEPARCNVIVLVTDHWTRSFFSDVVLGFTPRHAAAQQRTNFEFIHVSAHQWERSYTAVCETLRQREHDAVCLASSDLAMEILAAAIEEHSFAYRGTSLEAFCIATNKLACREALSMCHALRFDRVMATDEFVPDLGCTSIFKPLNGSSSEGVFKVGSGERVRNPRYGARNTQSERVPLRKLALKNDTLRQYINRDLVAVVEEYVPPQGRVVLGIDGCVLNGTISHLVISDNVYRDDAFEEFDSLVTPSQRVPAHLVRKCWEVFDLAVAELMKHGLDAQFVDVEVLVWNERVELMEVNCRTFCNQLPLFSRVLGPDGCMFEGALELLHGRAPAFARSSSAKNMDSLHPCFTDVTRVGVCTYVAPIAGAREIEVCAQTKSIYYCPASQQYSAHVYGIALDERTARNHCDKFYARLEQMQAQDAP